MMEAEFANRVDFWLSVPIAGTLLRAVAEIESDGDLALQQETFDIYVSRAYRYQHHRDRDALPAFQFADRGKWLPILKAKLAL